MNKEIKQIKMSDIIIPEAFTKTPPSKEKVQKANTYYSMYGEVDHPLSLDINNVLLDGYTRYLALAEAHVETAPCIYTSKEELPKNMITLVSGKFRGIDKEYVWRIPFSKVDKWNVQVGDYVIVSTCYKGKKQGRKIQVLKVWQTDDYNAIKHRCVVKKVNDYK